MPIRAFCVCLILALSIITPWICSQHIPDHQVVFQDEVDFKKGHGKLLSQLPPKSRAGLWNAGTTGYFASHHFPEHVIINLDGVVNNMLTRHEKEKATEAYLLKSIDVIIEDVRFLDLIIGPSRSSDFRRQHLDENQIIINRNQ